MIDEQLKLDIIKRILEIENKNIQNGYPETKEQMIAKIENIITEEVNKFEDK
ncbi:hypothetical protein [Bacillus cereus]|uniref:hypothetical protein n=1 Tax=Bacillus cereus TaxID=1396 RepID=UPI0013747F66|nr:hypothetical protein [Bacillus cereus]MDZ4554946.1 hypothetical protein [Bacillus cereus]